VLAALAVAAGVGWFARAVGPDLSVTVQSALFGLGAALALVGAASLRYRDGLLFLYAALLTGFVGYGLSTHPVDAVGAVVAVVATVAALLGALYLVVERRFKLRRREAVVAAVVLLAAATGLVAADLGTDPLTYETTVHDSAQVPADPERSEPVVVGAASVENDFVFREQLTFPPARACISNGTASVYSPVLYGTNGSYFPASVGPNARLDTEMTVLVPRETAASMSGTVPVERADSCPDSSDEARIVVVFSD
jgi:hypothetical protein